MIVQKKLLTRHPMETLFAPQIQNSKAKIQKHFRTVELAFTKFQGHPTHPIEAPLVALPINIGTGICTLLFPRFIVPFPKPVVSRLIRDEVDSTEIGFHNWQEIKDKNRENKYHKNCADFQFLRYIFLHE